MLERGNIETCPQPKAKLEHTFKLLKLLGASEEVINYGKFEDK